MTKEMNRDKYYENLSRKYGEGSSAPYNTPQAPRMTSTKIELLKKGIPLKLENGTIDVTNRGDLIFINHKGEISQLVNIPDKILITL